MFELNDFCSIKIGVASPEKIRSLSKGEVTKPETINYRTQKPERDGLFCERIFGPMKDWECHCGKYKRIRYKGVICEKCGVEVTRSKVRRERMGHIELAAPVSHIWYFRGVPSRIGLILDMSPKALEEVIYFAKYVVIDPGTVPTLEYKQTITDKELREIEEAYGDSSKTGLKVGMGAEAIRELLMAVDLDKECEATRAVIEKNAASQKKVKAIKRIEILEAFRKSGNRPEWMILTVLPVLPPELRPMVQLDGGRFASSDLNDLYRRVINRNNRLKRMMELGAPDMIVKNEKRMLQEAVDALIDNGRRGRALSGPSNRELKSLSGMLRGKQGRFRQNLLGKRVDYSGRSVIVVGPELKLYQCGLPKEMAIELFKPFVMKKLVESGQCHNIKSAKRTVEKAKPFVWDVLEEVIKDHPVLLNRAPTLHRLSIQAFEPVLIEGRAIKIHPLVCTAFNADFDGDQMAVHVPLSIEAQAEARFLMLSSNNILKLSDGKPVMQPAQDMVLGAYYLTIIRREEGKYYRWSGDRYYECNEGDEGAEKYIPGAYISEDEVMMAYQTKYVHMQDEVYVRRTVTIDDKNSPYCGQTVQGTVKTTVGRIIFNNEMPQDLGFVKREKPEDYLKYEISYEFLKGAVAVGKKHLGTIVDRSFKTGGAPKAAEVLDKIKSLGYKYSTVGAITTSVFDMHIPAAKKAIVAETEKKVSQIERKFQRGLLREEERYNAVIKAWDDATDAVTEELKKSLDKFNHIWMMANSGARGSIDQMKQLSGMRGLMVNPQGKKIEVPVKSCFRQGLSVLEYFISSHGGRKGLADTALKTADSGYLTRRLVDVAQDVIVREEDCMAGSKKPRGMTVKAIIGPNGEVIEGLEDRIQGRFVAEDVVNPATGEVIVPMNGFVTDELAKEIVNAGIESVSIRSVFTCNSRYGVCAKCYGKNMATNTPVMPGEAVGVIAAQSIGEPGTQLTMRTFHTGGIAATGDITQGLPRVEELFEARKPKGCATLCEVSGRVTIDDSDNLKHVIVKDPVTGEVKKNYQLPFNAELKVKDGEAVEPGTVLNAGSVYPQDILRIQGVKGVQDYLLEQVQSVYRSQGVDINDKHVEIIVRQMLRKVRIESAGSTDLLPGETVDMFAVEAENQKAIENGGTPALQKRVLLGITKAALSTESFLSAASFQETARVLTDAAIKNKVDPLMGLKENVIIGKLIPAGTGVKDYKNMSPVINTAYANAAASADEDSE
ncbi:MAG TPA: DNA-directed RNA polymerase subunit beta' [Candidatus Coproplasma avicola]|uniref:DNA-directed RNA polymerase subunit beta' n=1 Tax=Candidatus Coproplasma avicola TaxID=2840744 RepID=A0A9D1E518_9FIRM|nr:DNA-directed RNA polymerase subunit beta' [Candidatus Coproplasma avicola]